jgi:hypothetical protein
MYISIRSHKARIWASREKKYTSVGHHLYASISMLFVRRGMAFYLDAQGSVFIVAFFS